jgi:tryptophan synthase beta subunit
LGAGRALVRHRRRGTWQRLETLAKLEGILPALETAHALAWVLREGKALSRDTRVIVNLSGRGDKDVEEVLRVRGRK